MMPRRIAELAATAGDLGLSAPRGAVQKSSIACTLWTRAWPLAAAAPPRSRFHRSRLHLIEQEAYGKPMSANPAAQIPATPHQWASNSWIHPETELCVGATIALCVIAHIGIPRCGQGEDSRVGTHCTHRVGPNLLARDTHAPRACCIGLQLLGLQLLPEHGIGAHGAFDYLQATAPLPQRVRAGSATSPSCALDARLGTGFHTPPQH